MAAKKQSRLAVAGGVISTAREVRASTAPALDAAPGGGVEAVHGELRRKPGPRPDPAKRALKKYLLKLKPEHAQALRKAALERALAGKAKREDSGEVLRLLLDGWIAKGAKAP